MESNDDVENLFSAFVMALIGFLWALAIVALLIAIPIKIIGWVFS